MAQITSRGTSGYLWGTAFLVCAAVAVFEIRIASVQSGVSEKLDLILAKNHFIEHPMALRTRFFGIEAVDKILTWLTAVFMNASAGWDQAFFVQAAYFLTSFFPVLTMFLIESCRERNSNTILRFNFIFAFFYQTVGGAIIIPRKLFHSTINPSAHKFQSTS
jgi:hypothetical protein